VAKLKSVNGLSPRADRSSGQTLLVPLNGETNDTELEAFNLHLLPTNDRQRAIQHIVRRGESLGTIARRYHVKVANLQEWNHNVKSISAGQTLHIIQIIGKGKRYAKQSRKSKRYARSSSKRLAKN
jgi:membrane-bound lytic murein transglycosylase D